jgi:hypothetical protein
MGRAFASVAAEHEFRDGAIRNSGPKAIIVGICLRALLGAEAPNRACYLTKCSG